MRNQPYVTVGMPVFNGEDFIAEAIESILSQTYTNLELVISDNASTDNTEAICRQYAAKDDRVRYSRSDQNRGASWNYNQVVALAKGTYFRWAAADDACQPTLIEKSVKALDENPEVVLAFSWVVDIDAEGNEITTKQSIVDSHLPYPHERFRGLSDFKPAKNCEEVFGLIRLNVLKKTNLIDNYTDSDRTLLAELSLHGPFYEIPEPLFIHRIHPAASVEANPGRQNRTAWFDPTAAGKIVFPNWRQLKELLLVIWHGPISWTERFYCYVYMLIWLKRRRKRLGRDLVWAFKQVV